MSLETNRWTELTQDQAAFFSAQLAGVNQAVFSPAAHQAGVTPLNATRYSMGVSGGSARRTSYEGITWPDPYEANAYCVALGTPQSRGLGTMSFARISAAPAHYEVEGVALNLTYRAGGGNLYGKQLMARYDMDEQSVGQLAGQFLITAQELAHKTGDVATEQKAGQLAVKPSVQMSGVEGEVVARLFRSISSLGSNLVIAGAMNERVSYSDQTYDLAQTLLKMTVNGIARNEHPEGDSVVTGQDRRPIGAVLATPSGLAVIRRVNTYPETIGLTTADCPQPDSEEMFVSHHYIQARRTAIDTATVPANAYSPQGLLSVLPEMQRGPEKQSTADLPELSDTGRKRLEQTLVQLMNERATLPSGKQ